MQFIGQRRVLLAKSDPIARRLSYPARKSMITVEQIGSVFMFKFLILKATKIMYQLKQFIATFRPLTEACNRDFEAVVKFEEFERGEYLLKAGKICDRIYFLEKGAVQCYKGVKSKKQTLWFMLEGEIALFKSSFYGQKASEANIVALEDTRVFSITYADMKRLCEMHHSFALLSLKITEEYHMRSDLKSDVLDSRDPADRYNYLKKQRPDIVDRVPQKDLASFLRINPDTLSRIKKWQKRHPASDATDRSEGGSGKPSEE
jgi:CRP-like cAMP-binding protein